ncbi:GM18790 [Drosophila sechellia]|uniref:GM18790 n=1 Tax=Drosophila sechellia TaxID=7238 RepID=B4IQ84_DROSE|nr:GM18790 [Drosophila sechellia]
MTRLDPDLSTDDITSDSGSLTTDPISVTTLQEVFNSVRIPYAIEFIPVYEGNPKALKEFIVNVEKILIIIKDTEMTSYGKMLFRAIRNKIEGKANEALSWVMRREAQSTAGIQTRMWSGRTSS